MFPTDSAVSEMSEPAPAAGTRSVSDHGAAKTKKRGKKNASTATGSTGAFRGDRVLAGSIAFMTDGSLSREFTLAVVEGDVGRAYEVMKVRHLFLY